MQHHERRVAARSAHTLEANTSHDTTNHPAHQPHAAFTPACFALPSGTAPRKRTLHQGRANPNGIATSRTSCRHTVCPHTCSPVARRHANALSTKAAQIPMALQHHERRVATRSAHTEAVRRAFRTRLPPKVTLRGCKTSVSPPKVTRRVSKTSVSYETSSKSHASSLQNKRFVRDLLKSHASSLQNKRFVRDLLQTSHVKSPKQAFRTRPPQKVTRQVSGGQEASQDSMLTYVAPKMSRQ